MTDPRLIAFLDQFNAARREASEQFAKMTDSLEDKTVLDTEKRVPLELRSQEALANKTIQIDEHLWKSPQPVLFVAGMHPWKLRCSDCLTIDSLAWEARAKGTDEDFTCDLCGIVSREDLHIFYGNAGVLVYMAALCPKCNEEETRCLAE